MERDRLAQTVTEDLVVHEGLKLEPYRDTEGKLTIGIGRNLDDVGISKEEAHAMCANDLKNVFTDLDRNVPWWINLSADRQRALVNMCFNLGWPRLSGFKKMLAAMEKGWFERAADEALESKWARQVGNRAKTISAWIREG